MEPGETFYELGQRPREMVKAGLHAPFRPKKKPRIRNKCFKYSGLTAWPRLPLAVTTAPL